MLEIHDAEWKAGEVGTAGFFGAIFISKIVPQENDPLPSLNIVLLDEVEVDVMPRHKFIVYHIKALMDRRKPRLVAVE